ncbi:hypothetical protein RFI_01762 [Reticulomyxa filosa]|uniref:Uncharacterized protein n=1 Tax=Reticulomyxa filosa TaxID=46433 RepID=X6PAX4_RETFI|nr:hypothetical protein RFI_01762 [Reticulomyxa filosa]|eukprot:ETO35301.1 hypothetical protein RFI_01762 [Reticulomyxa filosa]
MELKMAIHASMNSSKIKVSTKRKDVTVENCQVIKFSDFRLFLLSNSFFKKTKSFNEILYFVITYFFLKFQYFLTLLVIWLDAKIMWVLMHFFCVFEFVNSKQRYPRSKEQDCIDSIYFVEPTKKIQRKKKRKFKNKTKQKKKKTLKANCGLHAVATM